MSSPPHGRTPPPPTEAGSRLADALRLTLAFRAAGRSDLAAFLTEHEPLRELLEGMLGDSERTQDDGPAAGNQPEGASLARPFGDYVLDHELGRGGVGVVYAATQRALGRRVALKVLSASMLERERALWRFQREARLLAQLEHPGIVRVIDAGTVDGVPFYAMELVAGAPLSAVIEAVRRHGLATATGETIAAALAGALRDQTASSTGMSATHKARSYLVSAVELIAQIADALAFAHAAGVVHRDVKPGNILVRRDGTALLSDFGIALQEGAPSMTATGEFAGTPYYVSPEQTRGPVDHRTDVYSLGVTLFELLTLRRPFDDQTTAGVLDRIQREEPVDPARINPAIPEDLNAVVLKAMAKEPTLRYTGAGEFAADLRAWAAGKPVSARRPTRWQRLRRWARREPWQAAACAAAVVLVTVSVTFTFLLWQETGRTRAALHDATQAETLARANFEQAMEAVDQMLLQVGEIDLEHVPQMEGVRRELLQRAADFYAGFAAQHSDDARVRLQTACARDSLGRLQSYLGDHRAAGEEHRRALQELDALLALAPQDQGILRARARAQVSLAIVYYDIGDVDGARSLHEAAIGMLEGMAAAGDLAARRLLAKALLNQGQVEAPHDTERARVRLRRSIDELATLERGSSDDVGVGVDLCLARSKLATLELLKGDSATARTLLEAAREGTEQLAAKAPSHVDVRRLGGVVHDQLALVLHGIGLLTEATAEARAGAATWQKLVSEFPMVADYRESLGRAWANLAVLLASGDDQNEAASAARQAVDVLDPLATAFPSVARYRYRLAVALLNLAEHLNDSPDVTVVNETTQWSTRALDIATQLHRETPADADYAQILAQILVFSGARARARGESGQARLAFAAARDVSAALASAQPERLDIGDGYTHALLSLAEQHQADGDTAAAAAEVERAVGVVRAGLEKEPQQPLRRHLARRGFTLAASLSHAKGDHDASLAMLDEVMCFCDDAADVRAAIALATSLAASSDGDARSNYLARALGFLERWAPAGLLEPAWLDTDAALALLRREPRFVDMRRGLPQR